MARKKEAVAEPLIEQIHSVPKVIKKIKFKTKNQKRFYKAISIKT